MQRRGRRLELDEDGLQGASRDIRLNLPGRHPDDSRALFRGRYHGVEAIHPEPAGYADSAFRLDALLEAPFGDVRCIGEHQTIVMAEIGGYLRDPAAFQIGGRSADDHPQVGKLARDQLRIRQMSDAKREVDVFLDHIDGAINNRPIRVGALMRIRPDGA